MNGNIKDNEKEEVKKYLKVMGYSDEKIKEMIKEPYYGFFKEQIAQYKSIIEKQNKYADPLTVFENPDEITGFHKLYGKRK